MRIDNIILLRFEARTIPTKSYPFLHPSDRRIFAAQLFLTKPNFSCSRQIFELSDRSDECPTPILLVRLLENYFNHTYYI